ncbi:MAG: hypothetical protein L0216_14950, partial [Planctomycetales bacterium]|nr:hypothetical protein [Planctomycetales bacterium]
MGSSIPDPSRKPPGGPPRPGDPTQTVGPLPLPSDESAGPEIVLPPGPAGPRVHHVAGPRDETVAMPPGAPAPPGPLPPTAALALPHEVASAPPEARYGKYVRIRPIGIGGMAEVWKAWDTSLGRFVALKFLRGGAPKLARFKREAQLAGRLSHPHIAAVYDVGEDRGEHYIALQLVPGRTLREAAPLDRRL